MFKKFKFFKKFKNLCKKFAQFFFKKMTMDPSLVTRAIQEDQILNTKLKLRKEKEVVDLSSFWELWKSNEAFRKEILSSKHLK